MPAQWSKLEKIRYLLDQWDTIFDPDATAPLGTPGDGTGVPLMPLMASHASVVELQRCLELLLTANPGDYRHLKCFHVGVETRIVWRPTMIRGPRGKLVPGDPKPKRVPIIPAWIDKKRVERGEQFLEEKFRGEVFIPDDLYHALTCQRPDCPRCYPTITPAVAA